MIEENKATVREIMTFDASTNQVIIINDNLKQTFQDSDSDSDYLDKGATLDASNNYVMDIMLFHAIFKQYMYKSQDIKKTICDCNSQSTSLTQEQKQAEIVQMIQARMQQDITIYD
jgi:hypothetical protein